MLITINSIEGNSGKGQAVFSRSGLTTVFQHKVFQDSKTQLFAQTQRTRKKRKSMLNTAQVQRELEKIAQDIQKEKQQEILNQIKQKPKSSYFKSVDREYYFNQTLKTKDTLKEAGHYKPDFSLIESKMPVQVQYGVPSIKEQIIEKLQLKEKSRDVKCCNRILRTLENQEKFSKLRLRNEQLQNIQRLNSEQNSPSLLSPQITTQHFFNQSKQQEQEKQKINSSLNNEVQHPTSTNLNDKSEINKQSQTQGNLLKEVNQSPSKQQKVLFFKRNNNFSYSNIQISNEYHMVLEKDDGIHPKITIQSSNLNPNSVLFQKNLNSSPKFDRGAQRWEKCQSHNVTQRRKIGLSEYDIEKVMINSQERSMNQEQDIDEYVFGNKSSTKYDNFSRQILSSERLESQNYVNPERLMTTVNSKYSRPKQYVQMKKMLSRGQHKLSGFSQSLDISGHKTDASQSIKSALEQFGYQAESPALVINPREIQDKLHHQRPNIGVLHFKKTLPRYMRNSIYSKDGIGPSALREQTVSLNFKSIEPLSPNQTLDQQLATVTNMGARLYRNRQEGGIGESSIELDKVEAGFKRLGRNINKGTLRFSYEKPLNLEDLSNSQDLYSKIIRGKEGLGYLQKLMVKKGLVDEKDLND